MIPIHVAYRMKYVLITRESRPSCFLKANTKNIVEKGKGPWVFPSGGNIKVLVAKRLVKHFHENMSYERELYF